MTQYHSTSVGGQGEVTQSVIISRSGLHWPAIICGVFLTLTLLIIAAVLAQAVGLDYTFQTVRSTGREVATIIWGGAASLICFGLGAYLAARVARGAVGAGSAMLNGFVVWAVTIPILIYVLGSGIGPMLGKTAPELSGSSLPAMLSNANGMNNAAAPAGMNAVSPDQSPHRVGHYQASAWWMLVSIGCGLVGSLLCGLSGTHEGTATDEIRTSSHVRPAGA
jgi:hypothetical protein